MGCSHKVLKSQAQLNMQFFAAAAGWFPMQRKGRKGRKGEREGGREGKKEGRKERLEKGPCAWGCISEKGGSLGDQGW